MERITHLLKTLRLYLVFGKFEGNVNEKKIKRKSRKKKKVKENNQISLNLINYFYIFLQTHFTYFFLL